MDDTKKNKHPKYYVKTVIIGNNQVCKTSMVNCFINDKCENNNNNNNNNKSKDELSAKRNEVLNRSRIQGVVEKSLCRFHGTVHLKIFDTAGQERYRSLTASYYRGAHGCLILFDVTKSQTFESVSSWFHDLNTYSQNPDRISTILVGTKCLSSQREVPAEKAEKFAEHLGIPYMEVSTEHGMNVTKVFEKLADMIIESFQRHPSLLVETLKSTKLTLPDHKKKTWCSC